MRLAPVPIRFVGHFPDDVEQLVKLAAESSLPTHQSPQCLSACRCFALVLAGLMRGLDREDVLSPDWEPLQHLRAIEALHAEVDEVASGSYRERQPPEIKGSGYVVKSLEAALWAFHDATDFRDAVLKAINLCDDADTNHLSDMTMCCVNLLTKPVTKRPTFAFLSSIFRFLQSTGCDQSWTLSIFLWQQTARSICTALGASDELAPLFVVGCCGKA